MKQSCRLLNSISPSAKRKSESVTTRGPIEAVRWGEGLNAAVMRSESDRRLCGAIDRERAVIRMGQRFGGDRRRLGLLELQISAAIPLSQFFYVVFVTQVFVPPVAAIFSTRANPAAICQNKQGHQESERFISLVRRELKQL